MSTKHLLRLSQASCLAAISVVLVWLIHFPLIPAAAFLEYDMADVPILLTTLLFGPLWGSAVLVIVSLIQAFLLGGSGWVGAVQHIVASGALVWIVGAFTRLRVRPGSLVAGLLLGALSMTAVMIPMNLLLMPLFLHCSYREIVPLILPVILPFNLMKAGINCVLTALVYTALRPFLHKNAQMLGVSKIL